MRQTSLKDKTLNREDIIYTWDGTLLFHLGTGRSLGLSVVYISIPHRLT